MGKSYDTIYSGTNDLALEIDVVRELLEQYENELRILLKRSGPPDVKAISYDHIGSPGTAKETDLDEIERISFVSFQIGRLREVLAIKEKALAKIKRKILDSSDKLNVTQHKVFIFAVIERRPNAEVAQMVGYSLPQVKRLKGEIHRMIDAKKL